MQVLKRINSEIEARRKAGENLPPPPKTAIAGPEYFGLNQPEVSFHTHPLPPSLHPAPQLTLATVSEQLIEAHAASGFRGCCYEAYQPFSSCLFLQIGPLMSTQLTRSSDVRAAE